MQDAMPAIVRPSLTEFVLPIRGKVPVKIP